VGNTGDGDRHRIFIPQALGSDEFLRVTWHTNRELMVFSHWDGDRCVAATPVRIADLGELASLVGEAATRTAASPSWPPPSPDALVVPAAGLVLPPARRSA
jgi:hypothetical protein